MEFAHYKCYYYYRYYYYYNFARQSSDQFLAEYDEVIVTAEGHVVSGSQDAVDPVNYHYQLPVSPSLISENQLIKHKLFFKWKQRSSNQYRT